MHNQSLRFKTRAEFKAKRKIVLARDHYKCQSCGKYTYNAEVHHVIPYRKCHTHDVDNMITLCHACHQRVHGRQP